jgi:hypothetical protein
MNVPKSGNSSTERQQDSNACAEPSSGHDMILRAGIPYIPSIPVDDQGSSKIVSQKTPLPAGIISLFAPSPTDRRGDLITGGFSTFSSW